MKRSWTLLLLCTALACVSPVETGMFVESNKGVVVCVDSLAANVGTHILDSGGNAVDAAIAVGFALAVTHPQAGNLGGGGFMVIRLDDGRLATIDYREPAPIAARPDMFLKEDGTVDEDSSRYGFLASGIPGTVAGFYLAHAHYGRLKWHKLLEPACQLAERGFKVDFDLYNAFQKSKDKLARFESTKKVFFRCKGGLPEIGFRLDQPDLARTLRAIQNGGRDAFYRGPVAGRLVEAVQEGGGIMSLGDLETYLAREREPLRWVYRDIEVVGMGLPTSGGTILRQMLTVLSGYNLRKMEEGARAHLLVETMRRAYRDRAFLLGDPDFCDPPLDMLFSPEYADSLREGINMDEVTSSHFLATDLTIEQAGASKSGSQPKPGGGQTTHFCVADEDGNVVSNTFTLEESFGCGAVAGSTGVLMNNEMRDFNLRPGWTDDNGKIGTEPNLIAPRKRMLSSMCPVILLEHGKPLAAFGSPGGRSIINTVLQVIINMVDLGMTLEASVRAPRLHHAWFPDKVYVEKSMPWHVTEALESRGHTLEKIDRLGDCHALFFPGWEWGDVIQGIADDRIDGCASGL